MEIGTHLDLGLGAVLKVLLTVVAKDLLIIVERINLENITGILQSLSGNSFNCFCFCCCRYSYYFPAPRIVDSGIFQISKIKSMLKNFLDNR